MRFNYIFLTLFLSLSVFAQTGTYLKPPALIEGFTTVVSAAGTTTLTRASQTKLIITGATTQTVVLPDATTMSTELGRRFFIINKSSGTVTVNASGGGLLGTIAGGAQAEVHLRAAGSAAGTWDLLSSSAGGGGTWGSITGTLSAQTDLQSALDLKAPLASPTFTGTITTPLTASRALVTGASSELAASAVTATQLGYLGTATSDLQVQLDAKQARSTLTTKGDLYVATASATVARQGVGSDGQFLMSDSTQTNGVKWSSAPNENLIFDGNAESGVTNFVEGSYSAATRPAGTFTASSGSGSFAISTSSSSPIFGNTSFLLTKSSGASRQGRAIERTINIDAGYRTKMLKTRIDYTIVSGSFVAGTNGSSPTDSSLIWYVGQYNGSTWSYTEPSTFKMFSNSTTNSDWVEGEFQVNADTTQLKLIGFISESANSAWVVKAEVGFKPSTYVSGTTVSGAVSKTFTLANSGNATVVGTVSQIGERAILSGTITMGSSLPTSSITLNLPTGYSMAESAYLSGSVSGAIGVNTYTAAAYATSATSIVFAGPNSATWAGTVPATWANGNLIKFDIEVKIQGWAATTQQSDGYDGREISAHLALASNYTPAANAVLKYDTVVYDKTNSYSTSTGLYTIPSPGRYRIGVFGVTTSASGNLLVYKNGTVNKYVATVVAASKGFYGGTTIDCVAGDTIGIYSDSNVLYSGDVKYNYFTIEKVASPQTISATSLVAAEGTFANNTINTGTTTNLNSLTVVRDSHGTLSTNGIYTIPEPGLYRITGAIVTTNTSWTSAINRYIELGITGTKTAKLGLHPIWASLAQFISVNGSKSIQYNTGDTVQLVVDNQSGTNSSLINSSSYNYFSIERIK